MPIGGDLSKVQAHILIAERAAANIDDVGPALLAQRRVDLMPVRITQHALGAALGGIVAGICVAGRPSLWLLIAGIGLIAGTRRS